MSMFIRIPVRSEFMLGHLILFFTDQFQTNRLNFFFSFTTSPQILGTIIAENVLQRQFYQKRSLKKFFSILREELTYFHHSKLTFEIYMFQGTVKVCLTYTKNCQGRRHDILLMGLELS